MRAAVLDGLSIALESVHQEQHTMIVICDNIDQGAGTPRPRGNGT
jgi:hypothetical protein